MWYVVWFSQRFSGDIFGVLSYLVVVIKNMQAKQSQECRYIRNS